MDQDKMKEWLIEYIDRQLPEEKIEWIEKNIRENEWVRKEYEQLREVMSLMDESQALQPDEQLKYSFEKMLQEEIRYQQSTAHKPVEKVKKMFSFNRYWPVAAAVALLIIGIFTGIFISRQSAQEAALEAIQQELQDTKKLLKASLQNQTSASQRLSGILASQTLAAPDEEVLDVLIQVLNHDDNTNVRLAALSTLLQYKEEPKVYDALLQSLVSQDDPVVQISLIDIIVELNGKGVKERLQKIINDDTMPDVVKEEAHVGLFKLL